MKKTIRINISGLIFNLDEDAYGKLQHYLNSITNKFLNTEDGNEGHRRVMGNIIDMKTKYPKLLHQVSDDGRDKS